MKVTRTSASSSSAEAHLQPLLELMLLEIDPGGACKRKLRVFPLQFHTRQAPAPALSILLC